MALIIIAVPYNSSAAGSWANYNTAAIVLLTMINFCVVVRLCGWPVPMENRYDCID